MVGGDEEGGEVGPAGGGVEVLQRGGGRSWLVGGLGVGSEGGLTLYASGMRSRFSGE